MNTVLVVLVVAVLALIAVAVWFAVRRSRSTPAATPEAPADPLASHEGVTDVRTLRAGDMVDYKGALYFVRGSLRLTEGGYSWSEHFLDDARGARCWISVEEDPDLEVMLWHESDTRTEPSGDEIEVSGVRYRLEERGSARYRSEGTTSLAEQGTVEYVDYAAEGERALGFERFDGGPWESGTGEAVVLSALRVYPAGSSRS
ncbi:MAG: DUF4178 domain-containing protein [Pseudonocardiaceae bacterium]|nr:DUF4178 domain-containing protein [Pseudonocardiaceae bacterium]